MEQVQELAEGPRENTPDRERTRKSVSVIYGQHSANSNAHRRPGGQRLSDSIAVIWSEGEADRCPGVTHAWLLGIILDKFSILRSLSHRSVISHILLDLSALSHSKPHHR